MMKSVKDIINSLDGDELCSYCRYKFEGCAGGVTGSPSGPIFPKCAYGLSEEDFELESYLEDYGEEVE